MLDETCYKSGRTRGVFKPRAKGVTGNPKAKGEKGGGLAVNTDQSQWKQYDSSHNQLVLNSCWEHWNLELRYVHRACWNIYKVCIFELGRATTRKCAALATWLLALQLPVSPYDFHTYVQMSLARISNIDPRCLRGSTGVDKTPDSVHSTRQNVMYWGRPYCI